MVRHYFQLEKKVVRNLREPICLRYSHSATFFIQYDKILDVFPDTGTLEDKILDTGMDWWLSLRPYFRFNSLTELRHAVIKTML